MASAQLIGVINLFFATHFEEGSVTQLFWVERLYQFPVALLAVSMGTALLPALSYLKSRDSDQFETQAQDSLKSVLALAFPAALGLGILAYPIIYIFFLRGSMELRDIQVAAVLLQLYSPLIVVSCFNRMFNSALFALKNTWCGALAAVLGCAAHMVCAYVLVPLMGIYALAVSALVASLLSLLFLNLCLSIKFKVSLSPGPVLASSLGLLPPTLAMAVAAWGGREVFPYFWGESFSSHLAAVVTSVSAGAGVYFFVGLKMRNPFIISVYNSLLGSWRKSSQGSQGNKDKGKGKDHGHKS